MLSTCFGNYDITAQGDVAGCTRITGDLDLSGYTQGVLELPDLLRVDGYIKSFDNDGLSR